MVTYTHCILVFYGTFSSISIGLHVACATVHDLSFRDVPFGTACSFACVSHHSLKMNVLLISKTTKIFLPFRAFRPLFCLLTSLNKFTNLGSHDCESLWQPMLELLVANKFKAYIE